MKYIEKIKQFIEDRVDEVRDSYPEWSYITPFIVIGCLTVVFIVLSIRAFG